MNKRKIFMNGIIHENPVLIQLLGMCPTLAVTTGTQNGIGMGLATTAVLICSNIVISLLRKLVPSKIRIPIYIVVIATFVSIVGMVMEAFVPSLFKSLGLFIPLIVVNCVILARAESFASKNSVIDSAIDGIAMGLGFTIALGVLGSVRELLGAGSIYGVSLLGASYKPALIMIFPPGAFLSLGLLLALYNAISLKRKAAK